MTLPPCRDCSYPVSPDALACPRCGAPLPARRRRWRTWGFEWRSDAEVLGIPLIHIAIGRNERGRLRVAKGVIAIGQFAVGLITFAQLGIGLGFGFGQLILGLTAIAQVAITPLFAIGQIATGYVAIGQIVVGYYGLCMFGFARHLWSMDWCDPQARDFFEELARRIGLIG